MKIAILDAATLGDDIALDAVTDLGDAEIFDTTPGELVGERVKNAEVVIVNKIKLGEGNLGEARELRLICVLATGYDNIDLEYCRRRGIAVCNVVGYSTHSVAQVTLTMALSLSTHLREYSEFVRSGEYTRSGIANRLSPVYGEICGKTWGIVGAGNIGKQVAKVAEAMGCRVIAYKRTPEEGLETVSIDTLVSESDIISIHTPLNDGTRNLISRGRIAMMKKGAVVVNTARGAVCDEAALADAIKEGRLGALGCDVYSAEPMSEAHPFYEIRELENVCLLPHMAWGAVDARKRCIDETAENIRAFFRGESRNRVE